MSANNDEKFTPKVSSSELDLNGLLDKIFDYINEKKVDYDGKRFEGEFIDHIIESALKGRSSRDRPPAEWKEPEHSTEEALSLVKKALTAANMLTEDEFDKLVGKFGSMSPDFRLSSSVSASSSSNSCPTFKVSLIGAERVGKTTFLKRWTTGEFEKDYEATAGVKVVPLSFNTSRGRIILNVWDCAGDPNLVGLEDAYWLQSHAIFLMFDVTNFASFETIKKRFEEVHRLYSDPTVVVCGNKVDRLRQREVSINSILNWKKDKNFHYYDLSAKSNYNFEKPWLTLLRKLTGDSDLRFVAEEPVLPAETSFCIEYPK